MGSLQGLRLVILLITFVHALPAQVGSTDCTDSRFLTLEACQQGTVLLVALDTAVYGLCEGRLACSTRGAPAVPCLGPIASAPVMVVSMLCVAAEHCTRVCHDPCFPAWFVIFAAQAGGDVQHSGAAGVC